MDKCVEITTDLSDGLKMFKLLEVISGENPFNKFERNPRMKIQKIQNIQLALTFLKNTGIRLVGIGAEDIVDGNLTLILGLIWTIILRFQIQDISEEELSAKEGLLLWVQKKTKPYDNVDVKNFHTSFQDGLAFCALIHAHRPDLIDYKSLTKANKKENLQLAFSIAEKHLDVPAILDPDDIVSIPKPDERSIMTYVAALYHVFATSRKAETAAKNIANLLDFAQEAEQLQVDYSNRAQQLAAWIKNATVRMEDRNFSNSLEGIQTDISEFQKFKTHEKEGRGREKKELEANYNTLQTKLRVNNRPAFKPPAGLLPEDIDKLWVILNQAEKERARLLREELRRQKHLAYCVERFKVKASALEAWVKSKDHFMKSDGVGDSLASVQAKLKNHETFEEDYNYQAHRLTALQTLLKEIVDGKHSEAGWCEDRYKDVSNQHGSGLKQTADKRKNDLEAELKRQKKLQDLLLSFGKKCLEFARIVEDCDDFLTDPISVTTVNAVQSLESKHQEYLKGQHEEAKKAYDALVHLAGEIKQSGRSEKEYSEFSIDDITSKWNNTQKLSDKRKQNLTKETSTQEHNENLRVQFAQKGKSVHDFFTAKHKELSSLSGDLDKQLNTVKHAQTEILGHQSSVEELEDLNRQLEAAEVTDNPHTELTIETIKMDFEGLTQFTAKEIKVLESELIAKKHGGVSSEELNEFKECFDHFDKNKVGKLDRLELNSCLKSLGQDATEADIETLLRDYGIEEGTYEDGTPKRLLSFESFVTYMKNKHSQSDSPHRIKDAFKIMAGEKDFITEAELRSLLPADKVEYLIKRMPKVSGGYDYNAFTESMFK
eukprot:TRINITY_DN1122_c0_g1_i8.p1 TRINITY_DN1122_c0_g1~~TRINITY_DN1122_c0_g1_i8.p1  ORF type:complete len:875 (-),score=266.28 TRINITY_DN1122_c0_g1_i8:53-2542(-)